MNRLSLIFIFILLWSGLSAQPPAAKVWVIALKSEIDPSLNRSLRLGLEEATRNNASLVVLDMDTYGGILDDADKMRQQVLEYPKPVFAFVNKNAASGGALIAIACDKIYMAQGANIGAATVVTQDRVAAPDKYQSYMRSIMRSTAEANGRDPRIAEGMVDEELEIDSIKPIGKILTFTTAEAIRYGYCDGQAASIEEALRLAQIPRFTLSRYEQPVSEYIIAFFLNPVVSGLLLLCILGGLYFELQSPGLIVPIVVSLTALALYLVPYYLNGLAANWEIGVFALGVLLLGLEIFVIPGFGVAGVLGILFVFTSLVLMMLGNDFLNFDGVGTSQLFNSLLTVLLSFIGTTALVFVGGRKLLENNRFKRMTLQTTQGRENGYTSSPLSAQLIGKEGVAHTVLRPSGKVLIDGIIYDATTRGDFIDRGVPVLVLEQDVSSLRVKALPILSKTPDAS